MTQQRPSSELAEIFDAEDRIEAPGGRFNLAPTDPAAVVVQREDHRAITAYRWGLIPHWADSPNTGNRMFNARAETLDRNPAFRYAFSKRRCLVPADAYYEWKRAGKVRQPYAIKRPDDRPIALAGLWAGWKDPDTGEVIRSFTVITTSANEMMSPVHNRMPVMIPEEDWDKWLDPSRLEGEALAELKGLLVPSEEDWLEMYPVSRRVNDVRNDGPDLVEEIPDDEVAHGGEPTSDPPESRSRARSQAPAPPTRGLFDLEAEEDTPDA
ncbi:MAG TPA: SOS response-associated peptidase [Candidatus Limnocylindrales bacterium]|nr:SOS response-associated peptidase [Candidatus Limnocylindrales bacterium]